MTYRLPGLILIASLALGHSAFAQMDMEEPPSESPPTAVPEAPPAPETPAASAEPMIPRAPAPPASAFEANFARANRVGLGLAFGVGSASLSDYHKGIDRFLGANADEFKTNLQISAELSLRYYAPYYVMGQIGYGTVYNAASALGLESHNLVMEVPILIGGYYTFFGRLYVHGAIGPSIFFFSRAYWDPGTDFEADSGVGMHLQFGAEYMVGEHFAVGLDLRYRSLSMGELMIKDTTQKQNIDFDMSGVAMIFNLRVFAI
ncbi:MAG: outer membrane beta-barrel protein [Deltaproteobacteria bacterium]|nr:outer membrane beta-barrel protein [Deltaproteobacteria bacterium]